MRRSVVTLLVIVAAVLACGPVTAVTPTLSVTPTRNPTATPYTPTLTPSPTTLPTYAPTLTVTPVVPATVTPVVYVTPTPIVPSTPIVGVGIYIVGNYTRLHVRDCPDIVKHPLEDCQPRTRFATPYSLLDVYDTFRSNNYLWLCLSLNCGTIIVYCEPTGEGDTYIRYGDFYPNATYDDWLANEHLPLKGCLQ